jgi:Flp pilus assembly protein TadG
MCPGEDDGSHRRFFVRINEDIPMYTSHPAHHGTPSRPARRVGATSVEFTVAGLVFFIMILGIFEIGRAFMVQHLLTNAAREGCRFGVLQGVTSPQIQTAVTNRLAQQGIAGDAASVQVNDGTTDAQFAQSGDEITVKVTVPVSKVTWLPFTNYIDGGLNLNSQYTLRRE